jgi:dihydrolipoamide dehydrogenase
MNATAAGHYDLAVIGCGPGGFAGAMRAMDLGRRVCVIEAAQIGGAGVMWGALASKTLWELAKDYDVARKQDRGYRAARLSVDFSAVRNVVMAAVRERQAQMRRQLETFSAAGRPAGCPGVTRLHGHARFVDPGRLEVLSAGNRRTEVTAERFLIATGSRPRRLAQIHCDQQRVLDSDGVLRLKAFPRRLVIVGAGIIGCEYATIFSNFGQTRVDLVDSAERIIPYEDEDVSDFVNASLTADGVRILHSAVLDRVHQGPDGLQVVLKVAGGRRRTIGADALLVAVGRQPRLDDLGLETAGIVPDARGFLEVDADGRVAGRIYACGDVTAHPALVNLAEMEGRHAVEAMFGVSHRPLSYRNMSTVMFFKPTLAAVGLNEKDCQRRTIAYRVACLSLALLPRAIAMRATRGFVKIIAAADGGQKILGMRAAGPQASNTIMSVAMLIDQDRGIHDVLRSLYPHPTMSEAIQECLRLLAGTSIYKPEAFPDLLRLRSWDPDRGYREG